MATTRRLTLRRETLTELTPDQLRGVVGAAGPSGLTCPVLDCLSVSADPSCLDCLTRSCW